MKIVVTGDRAWDDIETVIERLSPYAGMNVLLVEGECKGADLVCRAVAEELGFDIDPNPAKWYDDAGNFRRWAGHERNLLMLDKHPDIDVCLAFHNDIFNSKGTKHMLENVSKRGIKRRLWSTKVESIQAFNDNYRFLSSFFPVPVVFEGVHYPSVEHAYHAAKTHDLRTRQKIAEMKYASQTKKFAYTITKRPDWDDVRVAVMNDLVRQKFSQNLFKDALLATRDAEIVEGNTWNDVFWGVCGGRGENVLGKILMQTRSELQKSLHDGFVA